MTQQCLSIFKSIKDIKKKVKVKSKKKPVCSRPWRDVPYRAHASLRVPNCLTSLLAAACAAQACDGGLILKIFWRTGAHGVLKRIKLF